MMQGNIILLGLEELYRFLIERIVVGIRVSPDVFNTKKVIIDFDARSFLVNFFKDFIAFKPIGVAAFPTPNILTAMLLEIYPSDSSFSGISLNNIFNGFDSIFDILSINPDFLAIFMIPSQRAKFGKISRVILNASAGLVNIVSVIFCFVNIEYIIPTNIKTIHIIFTINY